VAARSLSRIEGAGIIPCPCSFFKNEERTMPTRILLAGLSLSCVLAITPVLAQDSVGGITIPAEEMESVRNHCETLVAADRAAMGEPVGEAAQGQGDHEENPAGEGGEDNAAGQGNAEGITAMTEAADAAPAQTAGTVDLGAITLEDCTEAELVSVE
jgi:hypothetical protein